MSIKDKVTKESARKLVNTLQDVNDIVRIVDPVTRKILYWPAVEDGHLDCPCLECNSVWGRTQRCPNCSSLEALNLGQRMFKVEMNNNRVFWVHSRPMKVDDTPCVMEIVNDVTDGLLVEGNDRNSIANMIEALSELAVTDALTSLRNRRFIEEFTQRLPQLEADNIPLCVAMYDLDNMKQVNDTYGHQAGDALLKDVAGFLQLKFESYDSDHERYCVRYGGDEFVIIAIGTDLESFTAEARDYYKNMRRICIYEDFEIPFTLSIGTASSDEFGWDWYALLKAADERMYSEKKIHDGAL